MKLNCGGVEEITLDSKTNFIQLFNLILPGSMIRNLNTYAKNAF